LLSRLNNKAKKHLSGSKKNKTIRLRKKTTATVRILIEIIEDGLGLLGATIVEATQAAGLGHL
jgi:hypothetical protein